MSAMAFDAEQRPTATVLLIAFGDGADGNRLVRSFGVGRRLLRFLPLPFQGPKSTTCMSEIVSKIGILGEVFERPVVGVKKSAGLRCRPRPVFFDQFSLSAL